MKFAIGLAAALMVLAGAARAEEAGAVGVVAFENSGAPEAQAPFLRGLALLHNFEYGRAADEFRKAEAISPDFAMAYWGEAMTYNHGIWMQQDRDAARAALAKLGKTPKARAKKAKTERERDYLAAVETLYGDGKKEDRDFLYETAMARLHEKYPGDVDAAAFHALAILGTAHAGRDFATYMRSAAILEEVYPENREHPGVLHYLIHSYDDPIHAPLGLRAARRYGAVAPDAGHALHMTSHIFVALGLWDDVIAMNEKAVAVVNAQRAAAGKGLAFCGHYPSWLVYGYLQKRDLDRARYYIDGCRALAAKELEARAPSDPDPDNSMSGSYLYMRAMLAADTARGRRKMTCRWRTHRTGRSFRPPTARCSAPIGMEIARRSPPPRRSAGWRRSSWKSSTRTATPAPRAAPRSRRRACKGRRWSSCAPATLKPALPCCVKRLRSKRVRRLSSARPSSKSRRMNCSATS